MPARTMSAASSPPTAARSTRRARRSRPRRRWRPTRRACTSPSATLALRQGDDAAAERAFRRALALAPGSVAAHTNLGAACKRQGRLADAVASFRAGLALYRGSPWWGTDPASGTAVLDPAQQETFRTASRAKLEFDLAQIDHLLEQGRLPLALAEAREKLRRVLAGFGNKGQPGAPRPLTTAEQQLIGSVYNRVIYRPPEEAIAPALNPSLDAGAIERRYRETTPSIVVVDDLLSAPAHGRPAALLHGGDDLVRLQGARRLSRGLSARGLRPSGAHRARPRASGAARRHHGGARAHADVGVQLRPGGQRHAQARGQGRRQRQPLDHARRRLPRSRKRPASPSTMSRRRPIGDSRTTISTRRGWSASWRARRVRRCTSPTAATGR